MTACLELVDMAVNDQALDDLYSVLEREIASSSRRVEVASRSGDEWLQEIEDHESERIERLLGWAFLAAQTFITTVRMRLKWLSDVCNKEDGGCLSSVTTWSHQEVFRSAERMRNHPSYTEIEVINAVANYWKHHDEWPTRLEHNDACLVRVWDLLQMKNHRLTVEIVTAIGMSPASTGNLFEACEALGVAIPGGLFAIRRKLDNWATSLQKKARSEVTALYH